MLLADVYLCPSLLLGLECWSGQMAAHLGVQMMHAAPAAAAKHRRCPVVLAADACPVSHAGCSGTLDKMACSRMQN